MTTRTPSRRSSPVAPTPHGSTTAGRPRWRPRRSGGPSGASALCSPPGRTRRSGRSRRSRSRRSSSSTTCSPCSGPPGPSPRQTAPSDAEGASRARPHPLRRDLPLRVPPQVLLLELAQPPVGVVPGVLRSVPERVQPGLVQLTEVLEDLVVAERLGGVAVVVVLHHGPPSRAAGAAVGGGRLCGGRVQLHHDQGRLARRAG